MARRKNTSVVVEPRAMEPGDQAGARRASFRFRQLGQRVVITNDLGDWIVVDLSDFEDIVKGRVGPTHPLYGELTEKGFYIESMDVERAIERYRQRTSFVGRSTYLHIVVVTLRCNEACTYCHASREPMSRTSADMDLATAKKVVDMIFQSPSRQLAIEFQGGEPLANFPTLKFIVEYAEEKNAQEKRDLQFLLVTNMSLMDDEKLRFLMDHDVLMCTSLDGPASLHDTYRRLANDSAHAKTVGWLSKINEAYARRGLDTDLWHVDALLTTTRQSFGHAREIVDEYVELGIKTIHIRPLNPMGFASRTWEKIGYTPEDFIEFYKECLDYIIQKNLEGVEIIERGAALFLARILSDEDHGYVDLRSPCGAGVGQLAYDQDGLVYTCDEGRMVARMGDDIFRVGGVREDDLGGVLSHECVRAIGVASCLEALPGCRDCAYLPYCGVCPVYNYVSQGDFFGQRPTNEKCRMNMLALDHIFDILSSRDESVRQILERWIIQKPRTKTV